MQQRVKNLYALDGTSRKVPILERNKLIFLFILFNWGLSERSQITWFGGWLFFFCILEISQFQEGNKLECKLFIFRPRNKITEPLENKPDLILILSYSDNL